MLLWFVLIYFFITFLIGVASSFLVKNSKDYILAGRNLPISLTTFALFATWFGSETILGAPSEFIDKGILGIIEDPFGAALCLILIGIFFAKPLYRAGYITFGDFYRDKFGRKVEVVASFMLTFSYFGWIAAQILAIGIILQNILGVPQFLGIIIGFGIVVFYTFLGGMWAVSLTDFIQTIMIITGLLAVLFYISDGFSQIVPAVKSQPPQFYNFFPQLDFHSILAYITAWIVIGLGSIPQQDVFQRVMSAKSEKIAVYSSFLAGFMYLSIGFLPLILALLIKHSYPEFLTNDENMILNFILNNTNIFIQTIFVGALLSAIMSTASGAVLAPASVISENLLKPLFKDLSDKGFLWLTRLSVIIVAFISMFTAFSGKSIYQLVEDSSALSLVSLFIPLIAGLFFKSKNSAAAMVSMISGFTVWILLEYIFGYEFSILAGLTVSFLSFVIVSFVKRY